MHEFQRGYLGYMAIGVGNKVTGKVTGIANCGAFVELGEGEDGCVHIAEVTDGCAKDINDVVSGGDEVTVVVTNVADDGKIALSIRRLNAAGASKPPSTNRGNNDGGGRDRGNQIFRKDDNRDNRGGGYQGKPKSNNHSGGRSNFGGGNSLKSNAGNKAGTNDFDSLMSSFLKDSDDRLTSLKRNTEGKRGGRGGRRY